VWNRDAAEEVARLNDIWPLTEDHWKVIDYVRNYHIKFGQGPFICRVCRDTSLSLKQIFDLFPCGLVKGAYRIAGLPRPPGCV
jgi:tRNA 2-thiouridine synthesizing protein E